MSRFVLFAKSIWNRGSQKWKVTMSLWSQSWSEKFRLEFAFKFDTSASTRWKLNENLHNWHNPHHLHYQINSLRKTFRRSRVFFDLVLFLCEIRYIFCSRSNSAVKKKETFWLNLPESTDILGWNDIKRDFFANFLRHYFCLMVIIRSSSANTHTYVEIVFILIYIDKHSKKVSHFRK